MKCFSALILALLLTGCAHKPTIVPGYLLNCDPQPVAPTAAGTTENQVGHFIVDLAVAGDDCRTKLGSVRQILSPQK